MTSEEIQAELRACLVLQTELAAKRDELTARYKAIIEEQRKAGNEGRIITTIDGEIYELQRRDWGDTQEVIEQARKFGGFYSEYRLMKIGKPI